jgi:hypothetical protein
MALLYKKYLREQKPETLEQLGEDEAVDNNPPSNPNDKYYLTTCYVCGEPSKPDQEHIRNYGGLACFSCRAFFRRATQRKKKKELVNINYIEFTLKLERFTNTINYKIKLKCACFLEESLKNCVIILRFVTKTGVVKLPWRIVRNARNAVTTNA